MPRNYGLGSRNMGIAGKFALNNAVKNGGVSFSTAATNGSRWRIFTVWAAKNGVKKMEQVNQYLVKKYGCELAESVNAGTLSAATAQVYVSAINTIMSIATKKKWESISPTKDCLIPQRSAIRQVSPGALDAMAYYRALKNVHEEVGARAAAVVALARELGLRSKEASLLDARTALAQAKTCRSATVIYGTKGGRVRDVPIITPKQLLALEHAARAQGTDRSMIPSDQSWKKWRSGELRIARELVKNHTAGGLHDLRAAFACQRYEEETGCAAPVTGGSILDKRKDMEARLVISKELGHGRPEIVSEYIGGRR